MEDNINSLHFMELKFIDDYTNESIKTNWDLNSKGKESGFMNEYISPQNWPDLESVRVREVILEI